MHGKFETSFCPVVFPVRWSNSMLVVLVFQVCLPISQLSPPSRQTDMQPKTQHTLWDVNLKTRLTPHGIRMVKKLMISFRTPHHIGTSWPVEICSFSSSWKLMLAFITVMSAIASDLLWARTLHCKSQVRTPQFNLVAWLSDGLTCGSEKKYRVSLLGYTESVGLCVLLLFEGHTRISETIIISQ